MHRAIDPSKARVIVQTAQETTCPQCEAGLVISQHPDQSKVETTDEALDQAFETLRRRLPETRMEKAGTAADKARAFEQWARCHPQRPPLREAAFRRENMIRDAE